MLKIIFLDLDWVLIKLDENRSINEFDEKCINLFINYLNLIENLDIKIVISSSRRGSINDGLKDLLKKYGFPIERIIWITPYLDNRENEIKEYLKNQNQEISYLVIDDDNFDLKNIEKEWKLIKINWKKGITNININKLIKKWKKYFTVN